MTTACVRSSQCLTHPEYQEKGYHVMLKQKSTDYRGYRNAGIRLNEEMLPQLGKIYGGHMEPFLPPVHAFDKAHTVMLVEEGLLTPEVGAALLRGLREMEAEGVVAARLKSGGGLHSG